MSPTAAFEAVRRWRDALRADAGAAPPVPLSPEGLGLVLGHALDALDDASLAEVIGMPGEPFPDAVFVAARTVATAPIEWLAVLLGRGTAVTLKHPAGVPGLAPWLARHARALDLPLSITDRRDVVREASLVVVMGDDATVAEVGRALAPGARYLGFGARASAAFVPGDADTDEVARALARDLAAHDSRGCMTPGLILAEDADALVPALADALAEAEVRWPRGTLSPAEHARLRERTALARATGTALVGEGWAVHRLPAALASPASLPRAAQVVAVRDAAEATDLLRQRVPALSTLGVVGDVPAPLRGLDVPRICPVGTMQAPPLRRRHDGVDAWRLTLR